MRLAVRLCALPILAVALVGCVRVSPEERPSPPEVSEAAASECDRVSAAALSAVQAGLDAKNGAGLSTATRGFAIPNPRTDASWLVGAEFTAEGIDPTVGVWETRQDPFAAPEVVYVSVDSYAETFSTYLQPDGYSSAVEGVDELRACFD